MFPNNRGVIMKKLLTLLTIVTLLISVSAQSILKKKDHTIPLTGSILGLHASTLYNFNTTSFLNMGNEKAQISNIRAKLFEIEGKNKTTAALLSLLWPGIGQFYVGTSPEIVKGIIMATGQATVLAVLIDALKGTSNPLSADVDRYRASIIELLMAGNIIYSMIDAGNAATEFNRTNGFSLNQDNPSRFTLRNKVNIISVGFRF